MKVLDFAHSRFHDNLEKRHKKCTIRLGDKTGEYQENEIVWVAAGDRFAKRKKLYTAVLDKVLVKPLLNLTSQDLRSEHPTLADTNAAQQFLTEVYGTNVSHSDVVTVLYFSEIL